MKEQKRKIQHVNALFDAIKNHENIDQLLEKTPSKTHQKASRRNPHKEWERLEDATDSVMEIVLNPLEYVTAVLEIKNKKIGDATAYRVYTTSTNIPYVTAVGFYSEKELESYRYNQRFDLKGCQRDFVEMDRRNGIIPLIMRDPFQVIQNAFDHEYQQIVEMQSK